VLRPVVITIGVWLITVGIVRAVLNEETTWTAQSDRTLGGCIQSCRKTPSEGVTALFVRGVINRALGSLGLVAEHTRALVAYVIVLGSPLTHL
jgi:hypothetical protein